MQTTPKDAALSLADNFVDKSWFMFVGCGKQDNQDILMVYLSKKISPSILGSLPKQWLNFPVKYQYIGKVKPV